MCAFPILILLSKPPDISFLIPYSFAFFRVWKLYLSGCLLFGLIICQKKLPQIEYLHKFIETAIGRIMFDKGKGKHRRRLRSLNSDFLSLLEKASVWFVYGRPCRIPFLIFCFALYLIKKKNKIYQNIYSVVNHLSILMLRLRSECKKL